PRAAHGRSWRDRRGIPRRDFGGSGRESYRPRPLDRRAVRTLRQAHAGRAAARRPGPRGQAIRKISRARRLARGSRNGRSGRESDRPLLPDARRAYARRADARSALGYPRELLEAADLARRLLVLTRVGPGDLRDVDVAP